MWLVAEADSGPPSVVSGAGVGGGGGTPGSSLKRRLLEGALIVGVIKASSVGTGGGGGTPGSSENFRCTLGVRPVLLGGATEGGGGTPGSSLNLRLRTEESFGAAIEVSVEGGCALGGGGGGTPGSRPYRESCRGRRFSDTDRGRLPRTECRLKLGLSTGRSLSGGGGGTSSSLSCVTLDEGGVENRRDVGRACSGSAFACELFVNATNAGEFVRCEGSITVTNFSPD